MAILGSSILPYEELSREESQVACSLANTRATTCLISSADIPPQPLELLHQDAHNIKCQHIDSTIRENSAIVVHHLTMPSNKLGDISSPPTPTQSPSPTPSLTFSLSDDEFSITDNGLEEDDIIFQTQKRLPSHYNHYIAPKYGSPIIFNEWLKFQTVMGVREAGKNISETAGSTGKGAPIAGEPANIKSHMRLKRRRETNDQNSDSDEGSAPTPQRSFSSWKSPRPRLACPFYKRSATRYFNCVNYKLRRVSALKEHLIRCHMRKTHCPRCFVTFDRELERDDHIRHGDCQAEEFQAFEGVTTEQVDQLGRAANFSRSMSIAERWYTIWDIIFPGLPRPASPYYDDGMQVPLGLVQEFIGTSLPKIFNERLVSRIPIPERDQSGIMSELSGIIQECFNQFDDALHAKHSGETVVYDINKPITVGNPTLLAPEYGRDEASYQLEATNSLQLDENMLHSTWDMLPNKWFPDVKTQEMDAVPQTIWNKEPDSIREALRPTPSAKLPESIELLNHKHQNSDNQPRVSVSVQGRKPPSYEMWEKYRSQIHQLYIDENRTLPELMLTMEESYNFYAS
ncbi:hypothetical protein Daesc_005456 [Daldinia eschscholtzii]|uniref:Clr5 domain-containing protein n=1 Tax=Daldinia eschscholtzii TaxID=292717 RepID=A0AAX6ML05_9PEZI